jgi:hypothetical protein
MQVSGVECPVPPAGSCRASQEDEGGTTMTWKSKLILGILTAVAMFGLSFLLPRGGSLQEAQAAQFPMTVGVWAIFVLLFVKLK